MNRQQIARIQAAAEALAAAAKAILSDDLRHELEINGSRVSAQFPFGTLATATEQTALEIVHEQDFFEWVRDKYPHQVEVVLRVPDTNWLTKLRAQLLAQLLDPEHEMTDCPPGTKIHHGGAFKYGSLTVKAAVKTELRERALTALAGDEIPTVEQLMLQMED